MLHYSQWTDDEAVREYARTEYLKQVRGLIDGVPELDDGDTTEYQFYRSDVSDASGAPACFVVVTVEFDGPDPERAREWVDRMFDADAPEEDPIPELFSAHFHVGADGTRALNYAEWSSEAAHCEVMEWAAKAAEDEHLQEAEETESDRATDSRRSRDSTYSGTVCTAVSPDADLSSGNASARVRTTKSDQSSVNASMVPTYWYRR